MIRWSPYARRGSPSVKVAARPRVFTPLPRRGSDRSAQGRAKRRPGFLIWARFKRPRRRQAAWTSDTRFPGAVDLGKERQPRPRTLARICRVPRAAGGADRSARAVTCRTKANRQVARQLVGRLSYENRPMATLARKSLVRAGDDSFVDAIAVVRGGTDAVRCGCQGDRGCKDKNQPILGDSLDRQGGRRALRDDLAPVCSLSWRWATLTHGRGCETVY